ncbi:hypothetical protein J3459_021640 [Metarhizium acridum]|uniref:Uncharacterized protein n=1 Tax=Metarhizium acridum (strain CQMa 102) TaxID=655827 RepID=E9EHS8_METAQ|nr:uncharacterized protein MAC_09426 [Metarhizium acridum CQMa 102]EFY84515.1 hypothetical protein MAC_09426 [Metarhizium acridum CQMa 102]KAG8405600.1 hypothetical protein J3459_021640 [Metarhizium acridum]KAG8423256.1 hypothetical protein J3458_000166 [Metarhizium acridum]
MKFFAVAVTVAMALGAQADGPGTQTCISPGFNGCNLDGATCCNSNENFCYIQEGWATGFCKKKEGVPTDGAKPTA